MDRMEAPKEDASRPASSAPAVTPEAVAQVAEAINQNKGNTEVIPAVEALPAVPDPMVEMAANTRLEDIPIQLEGANDAEGLPVPTADEMIAELAPEMIPEPPTELSPELATEIAAKAAGEYAAPSEEVEEVHPAVAENHDLNDEKGADHGIA
jgi:hypothetical protein